MEELKKEINSLFMSSAFRAIFYAILVGILYVNVGNPEFTKIVCYLLMVYYSAITILYAIIASVAPNLINKIRNKNDTPK